MRIQNNITADNSHRQLGINTRNISSNTEKLSSGFRVNRAADDAAGLAISEKMRTQIRGLNRASMNIQDGVSLLQVGDGALQSVHDKMQRLRELAVQSANGTNELLDRQAIQLEFGQLTSEINNVIHQTNFNEKTLFDGSIGASWEYNLGQITQPFITSIPAAGDFSPTTVQGWTAPATFFNVPIAANVTLPSPTGPTVPTDGKFAIQIITPADGTLNVVLDFETANIINGVTIPQGAMTWANIEDFFVQEFNRFPGIGHVVDSITFNPAGSLDFKFPPDATGAPNSLGGVMGKQPSIETVPLPTLNMPRVHVGIGGNAAQANVLNGVATTGINGFPGPFRANYNNYQIITTPPVPAFQASDFTGNNAALAVSSVVNPPGMLERASLPGGGFPSMNVNFGDNNTRIPLVPGNYANIQSFIDAHEAAFELRGFTLGQDDTGKLLVTAKGMISSPAIGSPPIRFTPTAIEAALALSLGFNAIGSVTTDPVPAGSLVIQSGANRGDIVHIELPRLCTRSLGLSIRRPLDEVANPTDPTDPEGFTHINSEGSDGYALKENVKGKPVDECSLDVTTQVNARAALEVLTIAINIISTERARVGAQQNRLEYAMSNVDNTSENLQAAESRIRDTDMAKEMTTFVQNQILTQSSTAMLAQANALPQSMLQLLG